MVYTFILGTTEKQRQFAAKKILEFIHNIVLNDMPFTNLLYLGRSDADFLVKEILPMLPEHVRVVATDISVGSLYNASITYAHLRPRVTFQHFDLYNRNSNPFNEEKFTCVISVWYSHVRGDEIPRIRTEYMAERAAELRIRDPDHTIHVVLQLVLVIINGRGAYLTNPPPLLSHDIQPPTNMNYRRRLEQQRRLDQQYVDAAVKETFQRCERTDVNSLQENLGRQFVLELLVPENAYLQFYMALRHALWLYKTDHGNRTPLDHWDYYTETTTVETIIYGPQPAEWVTLFERQEYY